MEVIKIGVFGEHSKLMGIKRITAVREYNGFTQYNVVDTYGNRLYSECFAPIEIERRMIQ